MKLHWFSPINRLGVGTHSMGLMKVLHKRGHSLLLTPTMNSIDVEGLNETEQFMINEWVQNRMQANSFQIPAIMNFHPSYLTQFYGQPRCGMVVIEINQLSQEEIAMIQTCDIVLTPSAWSQGVLKNHGIDWHQNHQS